MPQPREQRDIERSENEGFGHEAVRTRTEERGDEEIRTSIVSALMQSDTLDASEVEIEVAQGRVTLRGTVRSVDARLRCEQLSDSVHGVRDVTNLLHLEPPT